MLDPHDDDANDDNNNNNNDEEMAAALEWFRPTNLPFPGLIELSLSEPLQLLPFLHEMTAVMREQLPHAEARSFDQLATEIAYADRHQHECYEDPPNPAEPPHVPPMVALAFWWLCVDYGGCREFVRTLEPEHSRWRDPTELNVLFEWMRARILCIKKIDRTPDGLALIAYELAAALNYNVMYYDVGGRTAMLREAVPVNEKVARADKERLQPAVQHTQKGTAAARAAAAAKQNAAGRPPAWFMFAVSRTPNNGGRTRSSKAAARTAAAVAAGGKPPAAKPKPTRSRNNKLIGMPTPAKPRTPRARGPRTRK